MAIQRVKVIGKRATWATQFKVETLRGAPLMLAGSIATDYYDTLARAIARMEREVRREVTALFADFAADSSGWGMDASVASQARILSNALRDKFAGLFAKIATNAATQMVKRATKDSEQKTAISLREMSGDMTLRTAFNTPFLQDVFTASVAESVSLIKRIPEKYLDNVQGSVMRSIQTGNGLADLVPALDKYGVSIRNWSKNVALDQTRKAYNSSNAARMKSLGVKKFEWVHSGGSNHPRDYHKNTLNGQIFSFDDLPHLDGPNSGEKGIPGQAPYCRCTMRPVWEFDDDE
jgi:SPP1 gp7 family putative phage head morphogenesis protein